MFSSRPLEVGCYQIRGILKNKQNINERGIQNTPYFVSEAVSPYTYKYESKNIETTTEKGKKQIKKDKGDFNYACKCKMELLKDANNKRKTRKYDFNQDKSFNGEYNNDVNINTKRRFNLFSKKRGTYTVNPLKKSLVSLYRKRRTKDTIESENIKDINNDSSKNRKNNRKHKLEAKDAKYNTTEKNDGKQAKLKIKNKEKRQEYKISLGDNKTLAENVCYEDICKLNADKSKYDRCMCKKNREGFKSENGKHRRKKSKSNRNPIERNLYNDHVTNPDGIKRFTNNECLCKAEPKKNNVFRDYLRQAFTVAHNECLCKEYPEFDKKKKISERFRKVFIEGHNECLCKQYPGTSNNNECLCKQYPGTSNNNECLCKEYPGSSKKNKFSNKLNMTYTKTTGKNNVLNDRFYENLNLPTTKNILSDRLRKAYTATTGRNLSNNYFRKGYNEHEPTNKRALRDDRKTYTKTTDRVIYRDKSPYKKDYKTKQLARLGAGDQLFKSERAGICKNLSGLFKRNKVPTEVIVERRPQAPLFAIKVDSSNLEVINSDEIKGRVHKLGKVEKNETCICPSRLEMEKYYGIGDTCEAGVCELAGNDKYNRFNCKCAKKKVIKCNDSTCDEQTLFTKPAMNKNNYSGTPKANKPLFKMVLDSNQMNILNTREIEDILERASHTDICETGICSGLARDKRTILECKCINKKLKPSSQECDEKTCRPKRSKFYILCSRVFSGSDRWFSCDSRGRTTSYHPNRRQALVLGSSTLPSQRRPANRQNAMLKDGRIRTNVKFDMDSISDCECNKEKKARKAKQSKKRSKTDRKKEMAKNLMKTEKEFSKMQREKAREEQRKERMEQRLEEKKRMEIHKHAMKQVGEGNFLANLLNGLINLTVQTIRVILNAVISIIFSPYRSYLYTKNRLKNPMGTLKSLRRWLVNTWKSKESKFSKALTDSHTLNVLADHLEESVIFQTFSTKGQTQAERYIHERKAKLRQRRMRKRKDQALYGCRHILLTTLRKHPCLWVYHICPNFYPQCLSIMTICGNFGHILLFLGALLCWTPCIMFMELVRGCFCCMFCTQ